MAGPFALGGGGSAVGGDDHLGGGGAGTPTAAGVAQLKVEVVTRSVGTAEVHQQKVELLIVGHPTVAVYQHKLEIVTRLPQNGRWVTGALNMPKGPGWDSVAFVAGAAGNAGASGRLAYSYDGLNWSASGVVNPLSTDENPSDIAWSPVHGRWVVVWGGGFFHNTGSITVSEDGKVWEEVTSPFGTDAIYCVCWAGPPFSCFVAGGQNG